MVNVGIFYNNLEYFMAVWYNLWPSGIVCGHLLYFFPIWYVWTKKNLATLVSRTETILQNRVRRLSHVTSNES
jgi:hypothetical protein